MESFSSRCIKRVGGNCRCLNCNGLTIKYGKTKAGKQRHICKNCHKTQVEKYSYIAYTNGLNQNIILLTKEGLGIRSTARVLQISTTTLLKQ